MMLVEVLGDLQSLPWVEALRRSRWTYPLVNSGHIIGLALLFGAIVPVDLRMLGFWRHSIGLRTLSRVLLPVAAAGFVLAVVMGGLLFAVRAERYAVTTIFQIKIVLIAFALVNALLLHRSSAWAEQQNGSGTPTPFRLRAAAMLSIGLWISVIVCGRMIGYVS